MTTGSRFNIMMRAPANGPVCVIMGLTSLGFGLPFLFPSAGQFFHSHAYQNMGQLGGPLLWGALFTVAGVWRICAAGWLSYRQRKISTGFAVFLWSLLFLLRVLAEPTNPGVGVFAVWTITESWTLFRLRRTEVGFAS